jgi:hypothetical protein
MISVTRSRFSSRPAAARPRVIGLSLIAYRQWHRLIVSADRPIDIGRSLDGIDHQSMR